MTASAEISELEEGTAGKAESKTTSRLCYSLEAVQLLQKVIFLKSYL